MSATAYLYPPDRGFSCKRLLNCVYSSIFLCTVASWWAIASSDQTSFSALVSSSDHVCPRPDILASLGGAGATCYCLYFFPIPKKMHSFRDVFFFWCYSPDKIRCAFSPVELRSQIRKLRSETQHFGRIFLTSFSSLIVAQWNSVAFTPEKLSLDYSGKSNSPDYMVTVWMCP